ncbi:hypothetical protein N2152v2_007041 [Parachlorella kessleri]
MTLSGRGGQLQRPPHLLLGLAAGLALGAAALARRLQLSRAARQPRTDSSSRESGLPDKGATAASPAVLSSTGTVGSTAAVLAEEKLPGETTAVVSDDQPAEVDHSALTGQPAVHVTPAQGQPTSHSSQEPGLPVQASRDVQKGDAQPATAVEVLIKAAYPEEEAPSNDQPLQQEQRQALRQKLQPAQQKQQLSVVGKSLRRAFSRKAAKR